MGSSESRPAPVSCLLDLERYPLPDELLVLILSFVPARVLVRRCRPVCRRWRGLVDGPSLWRLHCERRGARGRALLDALRGWAPAHLPWSRLCVLRPLGRNLLRNPCGAEGLRGWEVTHGGDGWTVEENRQPVEGAEAQTCFVSSFNWCQKRQVVDLLREGLWAELLDDPRAEIHVSDWWGAREDCGCEYALTVQLLAANRQSELARFGVQPDPIPQWNDNAYRQVSHVFRGFGRGVRFVVFRHRGKDSMFWKGHYGARVTHSSLVVRVGPPAVVP
ncbi:F-box only protein 27 [Ornithorhynchus anatinus]|uniref:F-box protein 27 n=1 Tax=Ornithorhynchus anatinus TaxID=9258 RepID=A0A6I8NPK5_ORNAN|nr:F-box only protein 27 [Ornithorhynchus anatinus]